MKKVVIKMTLDPNGELVDFQYTEPLQQFDFTLTSAGRWKGPCGLAAVDSWPPVEREMRYSCVLV